MGKALLRASDWPALARRLLRFGLVGIASNAVLLAIFIMLGAMAVPAAAAAMIVYVIGVVGTYVLNRNWAFGSRLAHPVLFPRYVGTHAAGAAMQASLQIVFHHWLRFPAIAVQAIGMVVVAALVFFLLHRVVFPIQPSRAATGADG